MSRTTIVFLASRALFASLCGLVMLPSGSLWAQANPINSDGAALSLKQAFDAAWQRQPEAQSLDQRREAAEARRQVAESWTAEPPSLELAAKTDQPLKNQGDREYALGVTLPLWLPGERSQSGALAEAELVAVGSRASAAQLRTAASVRDAWWDWQRARVEQILAIERLENARRLASDVTKRVKAGDLARSDQHQADGAAATAEVALADAASTLATTSQHLRALTGAMPVAGSGDAAEPTPAVPADFSTLDATHPAVRELFDRAEVARRVADLTKIQKRNNPELLLATTRQRDAFGEAWQQTITVGVRFPFGSESRNRAKVGAARAEAIETEGLLHLERQRLVSDLDAARLLVEAAQARQAATDKRARLARESRAFFEKSFRLGETDLPTRLRIELEAVEAERQSTRARIDLAASISTLRQVMGLLPEQK